MVNGDGDGDGDAWKVFLGKENTKIFFLHHSTPIK